MAKLSTNGVKTIDSVAERIFIAVVISSKYSRIIAFPVYGGFV